MKNEITLETVARDRMVGEIDQTTVELGLKAWSENAAPHARLSLPQVQALAERRVNSERFPQYRGHFDAYEVVRVTRSINTKAGQAFKRGDLTIAKWQEADERFGLPAGWVAFSFRNGCDTGIGANAERFEVARGR